MRDVKILESEENWHRRELKEVINIHRKLVINRDIGQELPSVMLQLVSYDASHVTRTRKFNLLKKTMRNGQHIRKKNKKVS